MKKYNNPNIEIENIKVESILDASNPLEDGGFGDWNDGAVEEF